MNEPGLQTYGQVRPGAAPTQDEPPLPQTPTTALPGSREKVLALARRVESGQGLWHPHDRTWAQFQDPIPENRVQGDGWWSEQP
ncbi:MAG: hypothetical protein ACJ8C4_06495 [Gemmataceae bacterium]